MDLHTVSAWKAITSLLGGGLAVYPVDPDDIYQFVFTKHRKLAHICTVAFTVCIYLNVFLILYGQQLNSLNLKVS